MNGGAPIPLTLLGGTQTRFYSGPTLNPGDVWSVSFTNGCVNYNSINYTVINPNNAPHNANLSLTPMLPIVDASYAVTYGISVQSVYSEFANVGRYLLFCPSTVITLEIESPAGSGIYIPASSTSSLTNLGLVGTGNSTNQLAWDWSTGYKITGLTNSGNYRLTANDGCHTIVKTLRINPYSNPINGTTVALGRTIRNGTRGIEISVPDGVPLPITISLLGAPATATVTGPYNLQGTYNLITTLTGNSFPSGGFRPFSIRDLPEGNYTVNITDNCGASTQRTLSITNADLLTYNPVVTIQNGCNNANSFVSDLNINAAARFVSSYQVRLYRNNGSGGLGTAMQILSSTTNGVTASNLPSGDYIVRYYSMLALGGVCATSPAYQISAATGLTCVDEIFVPIHIGPYQDIAVSTTPTMCDASNLNSGIILAKINSGTPVYPLTWNLYATASPSTVLQTFTAANAAAANALEQVFTGLAVGNYFVRTSYSCYSVDINVSIGAAQVIPSPVTSEPVICSNANPVTIGIALPSSLRAVKFY